VRWEADKDGEAIAYELQHNSSASEVGATDVTLHDNQFIWWGSIGDTRHFRVRAIGQDFRRSGWSGWGNATVIRHDPEDTDDLSGDVSEMQEETDPGESGTESLATDLAGELRRLRGMWAKLRKDGLYWYETITYLGLTGDFDTGLYSDLPGAPRDGQWYWTTDTHKLFAGEGGSWYDVSAGGGGASTFLDLTDTPADYTGHASDFPMVNAAEDALVFVDHLTTDAHHNPITLHADLGTNLLDLSTQELDLDTQVANTLFAGPAAGGDAKPTFRALVAADLTGVLPDHDHTGDAGDGGQIDHGDATTGRGDDDHTIYLLADGTRALTGELQADAGISIPAGFKLWLDDDEDSGWSCEGDDVLSGFLGNVEEFTISKLGGFLMITGLVHGDGLEFRAEDTGGTVRTLFVADPDGASRLYHAGAEKLTTSTAGITVGWTMTAGDFAVSATGGRFDFDTDKDTSLRCTGDDILTVEAGGGDQVHFADGSIYPETDNDIDLGSTTLRFKDLHLVNDIRFYSGATLVGQIGVEDTTWFRLNQDVAKNIYTPRMFRAAGGLGAGAINSAAGEVRTTGDIRIGGGLWVGSVGSTPDTDDIHLDGSINKSTALACRLRHTVNQSIPNNTWTVLAFDVEVFDNDGLHSNTVNNSRITIQHAGVYVLVTHVAFATNATGFRGLTFRRSGAAVYLSFGYQVAVSGNETRLVATTIWQFSAGDYIEVMAYQNSGGALNAIGNATHSPVFAVARIA
jgi:hypothetical protein